MVQLGEMRRRAQPTSAAASASDEPMWARRIRSFDQYAKLSRAHEADSQMSTAAGGAVSLVTFVVLALLVMSEMMDFVLPPRRQHVSVDLNPAGEIPINFHLTFPAICCADVHIDSMDVSGEQQVNVVRSVLKQRLDRFGAPIGREFVDRDMAPQMYIRMPSMGIISLVGTDYRVQQQRANQEGCRIRGALLVNKVQGNFHIAVGRSHKSQGHHVHNFKLSDLVFFNTSHSIHELSFGPDYSGRHKPLDGQVSVIQLQEDDLPDSIISGVYQYHFQLTPTKYVNVLGMSTNTYQMSVTKHHRRLDFTKGGASAAGMPGVFFMYKLSPFAMTTRLEGPSLLSFITSVFAIVGGVYAVSSIIDRVIHALYHLRGRARSMAPSSQGLLSH